MRVEDREEIERLLKEYRDAIAEEEDAASRASLLADELRDLGVEPEWSAVL